MTHSAGAYSDEIYEVLLSAPYSSKLLCKLPKPIGYHGTEMINNKIFLFGGKKDGLLYDDVMEYDPVKNECKVVSKLPYPLRYVSTVQWENKVILNKMFVFQYLSTVKIQETAIPITVEQI